MEKFELTEDLLDNQYALAKRIVVKEFANYVDRTGKPYIEHIFKVEDGLMTYKRTWDRIDFKVVSIIALLHDLVEDKLHWNFEVLRTMFTDRIVDGVQAITKLPTESYETYIERVANNKDAVYVKLADLSHNMDVKRLSELTQKDLDRLVKYHKAYQFLWKTLNH